MADDVRARIERHARAFDGLMSLLPAEDVYGKSNEDQWRRKKQTKEQKREAKRAKLDPSSYKSALDVLKENEQKLKQSLDGAEAKDFDENTKSQSVAAANGPAKQSKKRKLDEIDDGDNEAVDPERAKKERKKQKHERRKARKREKAEAKEAKKQRKAVAKEKKEVETSTSATDKTTYTKGTESGENDDDTRARGNSLQLNSIADEESTHSRSSRESSHAQETPTFDNSAQQSSASSTSSIVPPSQPETSFNVSKQAAEITPTQPPSLSINTNLAPDQVASETNHEAPAPREKPLKLPDIDQALLKERLQEKLNALRAARKADGPDGKPARNRQELIDARRRKQEQRKAHQKELRAKAKEDAQAEAARLRGGTGSPLWSPGVFSPRGPQENSFLFGRVEFNDGTQVDSSMRGVFDPTDKKGPQDPKSALEAARRKQERLNGLNEDKRQDIEEKDLWLNAKKRIHGEKVRDNTSLLKKALKRKDKAKQKSEREWTERIQGVQKGKEAKQQKREENIQKRKDEKGGKGKGKIVKPPPKPRKRPGFEGTFKTGVRRF